MMMTYSSGNASKLQLLPWNNMIIQGSLVGAVPTLPLFFFSPCFEKEIVDA